MLEKKALFLKKSEKTNGFGDILKKNQVFSNQQQNKSGDVSRRLVENIIISLLVGHKLKKCGIFAFNEDLAQLDGLIG